MKVRRLVFVLLVAILALSFCLNKASASTKEEEYDELNAFFIGNDADHEQYLRELAERPQRSPQEIKYVQGRLQGMQERLESDCSKLKDCLAKAEAGNYIFIDRDTSKIPPDFTVTIITKQEFYDKSTEAANSPNLDKTKYIRAIDVSTKYIKEEGARRLKRTEKLLQKTQEWKAYYLGEGPKPSEPGQSADSTSTDNKSQIESIYQKINTFLAENREMYTKDLNESINTTTTNPEEIKKIVTRIERIEKDLEGYCGKLEDCIAKIKDGNYIGIILYRWPAFVPQLTAKIITKNEYVDKVSDAALNPTPEKTNFIITVDVSTEYIKKDGLSRLSEIEKLLEEVKKWKSYYINQLAKLTAAGGGNLVWRLKETVVDPKKASGTTDNMGYVWKIDSAVSASAKNNYTGSTKSITLTEPPTELKANDKFDITITLKCDKEGGGDCYVGLMMPFERACYGCTTAPGQNAFSSCENHATKTFVSTCSTTEVVCDTLEFSPSISDNAAPLATYVYEKKELNPQEPLTNAKPEVQQPLANAKPEVQQPTANINPQSAAAPKQVSVEEGTESILGQLPQPTIEPDTDRPGLNYDSFDLSTDDPKFCRNACTMDTKCKAYTYFKPGAQGQKARCVLKTGVSAPQENTNCISGVKP
jgi:tetrahydromethanopterin S-methyltransferase subunit G